MNVVFDLEIAKTVEEVGGWKHTDKMGISTLVAYIYQLDEYRVYDKNNIAEFGILVRDSNLISFNGLKFDMKVLKPYGTFLPKKHFDILHEIKQKTGGFKGKGVMSLDAICRETLGIEKDMSGAMAPILWQQGKIGQLCTYNIKDVKMTRDLFNFIQKYKYVILGNGERVKLK